MQCWGLLVKTLVWIRRLLVGHCVHVCFLQRNKLKCTPKQHVVLYCTGKLCIGARTHHYHHHHHRFH